MGELNTMSINFLDPEKCRFYINPNGFTALKTEDKDYRRVRLLRTLPLHRPFEYISVSDMDKNEIGIIRNAADFPSESREIIEKDLAARYYCPQISEIYSIDEKMGSFYFDVSIDGFKKTFCWRGADIATNFSPPATCSPKWNGSPTGRTAPGMDPATISTFRSTTNSGAASAAKRPTVPDRRANISARASTGRREGSGKLRISLLRITRCFSWI